MIDHDQRLARGMQVVPWLAALTGMAWWQGMVGVFAKTIALPPVAIVCFRCFLSAVVLGTVAWAGRRTVPSGARARWGVLITGLLLAVHWATLFMAYTMTDIALVVVGIMTFPIFVAFIEPIVFGKRLGWSQIGAAVIVLIGVVLLDPGSGSGQPVLGFALAVFSAVVFAFRNVYSRKLMAGGDGIALTAWQTAIAAVLLSPWIFDQAVVEASWQTWGMVVLLGIFFTALPHTFHMICMDRLTATSAGIVGSQQIIAGILYGWLLLDERVSWHVWGGAVVVMSGVAWEALATWRRRRVVSSEGA